MNISLPFEKNREPPSRCPLSLRPLPNPPSSLPGAPTEPSRNQQLLDALDPDASSQKPLDDIGDALSQLFPGAEFEAERQHFLATIQSLSAVESRQVLSFANARARQDGPKDEPKSGKPRRRGAIALAAALPVVAAAIAACVLLIDSGRFDQTGFQRILASLTEDWRNSEWTENLRPPQEPLIPLDVLRPSPPAPEVVATEPDPAPEAEFEPESIYLDRIPSEVDSPAETPEAVTLPPENLLPVAALAIADPLPEPLPEPPSPPKKLAFLTKLSQPVSIEAIDRLTGGPVPEPNVWREQIGAKTPAIALEIGEGYARSDRPDSQQKAAWWFQRAADAGDSRGWFETGRRQLVGEGLEANPEAGYKLLYQAQQAGDSLAAYLLGICETHGLGVEKPRPSHGRFYLQEASQKGVAEAWYELGLLSEGSSLGEPNPEWACKMFRNGAEAGHRESMLRAADYYEEGKFITRDPEKAAGLRHQASETATSELFEQVHELIGMSAGSGE